MSHSAVGPNTATWVRDVIGNCRIRTPSRRHVNDAPSSESAIP